MNYLQLAEIAKQSYTSKTGCVNDCEYLTLMDIDGTLIIAVRGTEITSITDIIRDLRFMPRYHSATGWCHGGFLRGARRLAEVFDGDYITQINPHRIIFTGHSLGAAISLLLATIVKDSGLKGVDIKWVGFGSPSPFIGKRYLSFETIAFKNSADIVTTLPRGWLFSYRLNVWKEYILGDTASKNYITDHYMNSYIESLQQHYLVSNLV